MLYDVYITYYDGSYEYLLGMYDNNDACLAELQGFREYRTMAEITIIPKYTEVDN